MKEDPCVRQVSSLMSCDFLFGSHCLPCETLSLSHFSCSPKWRHQTERQRRRQREQCLQQGGGRKFKRTGKGSERSVKREEMAGEKEIKFALESRESN